MARVSADVPLARDGSPLRIEVLGRLTARLGESPVDVGGRKQRAVLAVLVLARGDVVPADRMMDSLWGDRPPGSAESALHAYISHLRRSLEPERSARSKDSVIARQGPGYSLRVDGDGVDSWQFERLVRQAGQEQQPHERTALLSTALGLWRGPAFADFSGEQWVDAEVTRLDELREVAREQLALARLDAGGSALVVPEAEELVNENPLREERWRLLVLALYRSHRQADALAALRRARQTLADELGVDPGPALRELEARVLAQAPDLDAPAAPRRRASDRDPAPARAGAAPPAPAPAPGPPPDDLVDRDRELSVLRRCLAEAWAGQGQLALVEGPAGIGKSRLLAEVRRLAVQQGARTLSARGSQMEREFGFGAVRQLFEPTLADPAARATLLAGSAGSAAGVFDAGADGDAPHQEGTFAALHGLYWLTVNLAAESPLLLAVDDLQWCDTGSLRLLAYLLRRLEGLPVLIVATLRTGEPHAVEALLAELMDDPATVAVRPGPLTVAGVADLVRTRLGDPAAAPFVAACHRTTSGNPLLLRQLLRALESDRIRPDASHADTVTAIGSRAVSSMVLMRLARLPVAAAAAARAVAVLGDGAELPAVAALAGLPENDVAAAVATLARVEVLRDEYPLGFVHPLVRDAVYRDLPTGERELQHERAARVLDAGHAAAEQVAAQLLQVPRRGDAWVVDVLRRAAATAGSRGAAEGAVAYLRRALAEPPPPADQAAVLVELGEVETLVDGPAALEHLAAAYDLLPDGPQRGRLAQNLARTLVFAGGQGEATAFARRAVDSLPEDCSDERAGLIALERIGGFMHGVDPAVWRAGPAPEIVGTGPGARMLAAEQAWETFIDGTDRARCVELARFALEGGELLEADAGLLWVVAAMVQDFSDVDVSAFWDAALAGAYERGSLFAALSVHLWRGYMHWRRGELREALDSLRTANEQTRMWGAPAIGAPYGEAFVIGVLLDMGQTEGARAFLEDVRDHPRLGDGLRLVGEAEAKVLYAEGRHDESLRRLDEVVHLQECIVNPVWRPWRSLRSHPLNGLGRTGEAVALLEEELRLVRVWGARSTIGRTLRMLAEMRDDESVAIAELEESIEHLSGGRARLQLARAHFALGRRLPPEQATPHLQQALALFDATGALLERRAVAAALAGVGLTVPAEPVGTTSLTTTERAMADMAVEGADERTIAQALFVTPRTVETTLATLRERLGCGPDADLRSVLAGS